MSQETLPYRVRIGDQEFVEDIPVHVDPEGEEVVSMTEGLKAEQRIALRAWRLGLRNGELLAFMRRSLGLPAGELANLLHVTPETLSRWEHGVRAPREDAFELLALLVRDATEGHSRTLRFLEAPRHLPFVIRRDGSVREVLPDESDAHALFARLVEEERLGSYRLEQGDRILRQTFPARLVKRTSQVIGPTIDEWERIEAAMSVDGPELDPPDEVAEGLIEEFGLRPGRGSGSTPEQREERQEPGEFSQEEVDDYVRLMDSEVEPSPEARTLLTKLGLDPPD